MLIVIGRAEADPDALPQLRAAMAALMVASRAEQGCLSYSLAVEDEGGDGRPAVLSIAERWADEAALKAHSSTAHMQTFREAIAGKIKRLEVQLYAGAEERPFPR